ncbi:MAG: HEAT repeat domain-containing protein [Pyrinomonadaceae bacterium]
MALIAVGQNLPANDWQSRAIILQTKASSGTIEEKRDALFEIRNARSELASRLALPALRDANEIVRATAAASVVFLPRDEAAAVVMPLLGDRAEFVRREAAYALGVVGSAQAVNPLIELFRKEKVVEVRGAIAVALGQIGDRSALSSLINILQRRPTEDDEFVRRSAARSIGQIAQIAQIGLRRVLTPQNFLPEKFKDLRASDVEGFAESIAILTRVLTDRKEADDTRREAAFALGAINDESSSAVLRSFTTSDDPYLAEIAKEAIAKISASQYRKR